jgi:hypothetical protein
MVKMDDPMIHQQRILVLTVDTDTFIVLENRILFVISVMRRQFAGDSIDIGHIEA